MAETKKPAPKGDTSLGGGLYRDDRGSSKSFVFRGRVSGKQVRKVLLNPVTGLPCTVENTTVTEARRYVADMKGDAANGGKKHFAHIDAKPKPGDWTVKQAWEAYMKAEGSQRRERTVEAKKALWTRFIEPAWGDRAVRTISRRDCMALLSDVRQGFEAKGQQGTTTNVLHSNLGAFFKWCLGRIELGVETDPMFGVPRPVKEKPDPPRPLTTDELKTFFRAAAEVRATRARAIDAVEFLLRSSCRRNEIFDAQWGWLREDGLMIPAEKSKNGCAILVPLTDTMKALLGERPDSASDNDRIFVNGSRWLSDGFEVLRDKMGFHFTLHDFRDTFMTLMEEPQNEYDQPLFPMETRDACLNHRPGGVGAKHYHGGIREPRWFYAQRRGAGIFWNRWLDELKADALSQRKAA